MEILPLIKTYYPYTSLCNTCCSINSKRNPTFSFEANSISWDYFCRFKGSRLVLHSSYGEGGSIVDPGLENMPLSVDLEPLSSETQFDRIVADGQRLEESVVVLWMANWCRKCIYLKPKLEKLAADYYPRVRFYSIDVNNVPHKLVVRAGVTKMPTIQLWRDAKKQAEVIGGHKAHLVVSEVRDMIENGNDM